jgi:hypothetical protein
MTREEAIKILEEIIDEGWLISDFEKCTAIDACEMAIEALEKEPCEDAVSRQAVLEYIEGSEAELGHSSENELVCQDIKKLPPVTPQPQTGHWIKTISENGITSAVRCSECGFEDNRYMLFRYCPNCGAKMVAPQAESEDK